MLARDNVVNQELSDDLQELSDQLSNGEIDINTVDTTIRAISFSTETNPLLFDLLLKFFEKALSKEGISFVKKCLEDLLADRRIETSRIAPEVIANFYKNLASSLVSYPNTVNGRAHLADAPDGRILAADCFHHASFYQEVTTPDAMKKLAKIQKKIFLLMFSKDSGQIKYPDFDGFETGWLKHYLFLKEIREKAYNDLKNTEITTIQVSQIRNDFNRSMIKMVREISAEIVSRIEAYSHTQCPGDFALICVGSAGLNYLTSYSDFDIAILVKDERQRNSLFFKIFLELLVFDLICLGENVIQRSKDGKLRAGSKVDSGDVGYILHGEKTMLNTPKGMAEHWFSQQIKDSLVNCSFEANSVLRPTYCYSYYENSTLYQDYLNEMQGLWHAHKMHQVYGCYLFEKYLASCIKDTDKAFGVLDMRAGLNDDILDFKAGILRSPVLWVSYVAMILGGVHCIDIDSVIDYLRHKDFTDVSGSTIKVFDESFIADLEATLANIWRIKFQFECEYKFYPGYRLQREQLSDEDHRALLGLVNIAHSLLTSRKLVLKKLAHFLFYRERCVESLSAMVGAVAEPSSGNPTFYVKALNYQRASIDPLKDKDNVDIFCHSLRQPITQDWVRKVTDDLYQFNVDQVVGDQCDFVSLSRAETQLAFCLNALPTSGYHESMAELWSYFFDSSVAHSLPVVIDLFGVEHTFLLIPTLDQSPDYYHDQLTDSLFAILLLRTILFDAALNEHKCYFIYCLDKMSKPISNDIKDALRTWSKHWESIYYLWVNEINNQTQIIYEKLGCITSYEWINKIDENSPAIKDTLENVNTLLRERQHINGFDLLTCLRPDCVSYIKASLQQPFQGSRDSIARQRCDYVNQHLSHSLSLYHRMSRLYSPKRILRKWHFRRLSQEQLVLLDEFESLRESLMSTNKSLRIAARDRLRWLNKQQQWKVIEPYLRGAVDLAVETSQSVQQFRWLIKCFTSLSFPVTDFEQLQLRLHGELHQTICEHSDIKRMLEQLEANTSDNGEDNEKAFSYTECDKIVIVREQKQLRKINRALVQTSDEDFTEASLMALPEYYQSIFHAAAVSSPPEILLNLIARYGAQYDALIASQNYAGWNILHYVMENRKKRWTSNDLHELLQALSSKVQHMCLSPNIHGFTPLNYLVKNQAKTWGERDIVGLLESLGDQAKIGLSMLDAQGMSLMHHIVRNKSPIYSHQVLETCITCLGDLAIETILYAEPQWRWTLIHFAIYDKSLEDIQLLLDQLSQQERHRVLSQHPDDQQFTVSSLVARRADLVASGFFSPSQADAETFNALQPGQQEEQMTMTPSMR